MVSMVICHVQLINKIKRIALWRQAAYMNTNGMGRDNLEMKGNYMKYKSNSCCHN